MFRSDLGFSLACEYPLDDVVPCVFGVTRRYNECMFILWLKFHRGGRYFGVENSGFFDIGDLWRDSALSCELASDIFKSVSAIIISVIPVLSLADIISVRFGLNLGFGGIKFKICSISLLIGR